MKKPSSQWGRSRPRDWRQRDNTHQLQVSGGTFIISYSRGMRLLEYFPKDGSHSSDLGLFKSIYQAQYAVDFILGFKDQPNAPET